MEKSLIGGGNMKIITQTIRIIDYESNKVYTRATPETFSEYIEQLITYINGNTSVREYKTRSVHTEVVSSILELIKNRVNDEIVEQNVNMIAERLLLKEVEAQQHIVHLSTNVQKGSLVQALLYDEENDKYVYLLAKVEHTDFVDDSDFSFKTGFSKDKKTMWKSCLLEVNDLTQLEYYAYIYSNTVAKYWHSDFLELDELKSDESNTNKAFRAIENTLSRNIKKDFPKDHTIIRNAIISYFKSNDQIDYNELLNNTIGKYQPVEIPKDKMVAMLNKLQELPDKYEFDRQFNSTPSVINARIRKVYSVYQGIELRITDAVDDIENTIQAYRADDGNRYLQIRTNNDLIFKQFLKQE